MITNGNAGGDLATSFCEGLLDARKVLDLDLVFATHDIDVDETATLYRWLGSLTRALAPESRAARDVAQRSDHPSRSHAPLFRRSSRWRPVGLIGDMPPFINRAGIGTRTEGADGMLDVTVGICHAHDAPGPARLRECIERPRMHRFLYPRANGARAECAPLLAPCARRASAS